MATDTDRREDTTIAWDAFIWSGGDGARTALAIPDGGGWNELSYADLRGRAEEVSSYLIEKGVGKGDRVAILSESRPEWGIAFFAAIRSGAIVVPLDAKLTLEELAPILSDAGPRTLFVSTAYVEAAQGLKALVSSLDDVVVLDGGETPGELPSMAGLRGASVVPGEERHLDDTAVITYTSGTTGSPKGVMTTFGNLAFQVRTLQQLFHLGPQDVALSILPLNHLLELSFGFLGILSTGGQVCYSNTLYPEEITRIMRERRVTRMVVVPLFLRLLQESIEKEVGRSGPWRRGLFRTAIGTARWAPARSLRRLLFSAVHSRFGGALTEFVSGGAALDVQVADFFHRLGFSVYQGYGLTETSPGVSVNTAAHHRPGSVGRPFPGVSVRILKSAVANGNGEILTRGPHVMKGYYRRDDLTREAVDSEGWLHTGDLGRVDRDGFLYITGRAKSLIVLAGGKKVVPEEVEEVLSRGSTVKEVCVVGARAREGLLKGTEQVCAVVVPEESLALRLGEHTGALEEAVRQEVERLSRRLAPYKRPARTILRLDDLPRTATRKVRRPLVHQWVETQEEMES